MTTKTTSKPSGSQKAGPQKAHPIVAKFAANMRGTRKKRKLSQGDLAQRMGIAISYVSMLERGKRNPPLSTVGDAAKALGVKAVDLIR